MKSLKLLNTVCGEDYCAMWRFWKCLVLRQRTITTSKHGLNTFPTPLILRYVMNLQTFFTRKDIFIAEALGGVITTYFAHHQLGNKISDEVWSRSRGQSLGPGQNPGPGAEPRSRGTAPVQGHSPGPGAQPRSRGRVPVQGQAASAGSLPALRAGTWHIFRTEWQATWFQHPGYNYMQLWLKLFLSLTLVTK